MKRRSVIAGLGAIIGGSAVVSSGAFTSVEADREVEIEVEEEDAAYLQFEKSDGDNEVYFDNTTANKLRLDFNEVAGDAFGPNRDASWEFDNVFVVQNDGSQSVYFWLEDFRNPDGDFLVEEFNFYVDDDPSAVIDGDDGVVELPVGDEVSIGVSFETKDETADDNDDEDNVAEVEANADKPSGVDVYDEDGNIVQS